VFTPGDAAHVTAQVARALVDLHTLKPPMMHRDVKPDNILLYTMHDVDPERMVAVLTDFGISRTVALGPENPCAPWCVREPPARLERHRGRRCDRKADGPDLADLLQSIQLTYLDDDDDGTAPPPPPPPAVAAADDDDDDDVTFVPIADMNYTEFLCCAETSLEFATRAATTTGEMTTRWFVAPEMLGADLSDAARMLDVPYGPPVDVWALGVSLLIMMGGGQCFKYGCFPDDVHRDTQARREMHEFLRDLAAGRYATDIYLTPSRREARRGFEGVPAVLHPAVTRMLDPDPTTRATATEAAAMLAKAALDLARLDDHIGGDPEPCQ
jgi:serine/threonine protein kinase